VKPKQLRALVRRHKERYRQEEKDLFELNTRFYNGAFYENSQQRFSLMRHGSTGTPLAAVNLIFALTESVCSSMLGRDISVVAKGADEKSEQFEFIVTRMLANEFARNKFRMTAQVSLTDAVLNRRGCFKVIPDKANQGARILEVHPRYLGYSPDARVLDDSSYFIQCVPLPWRQFKANIDSGAYLSPKKGAKPEGLPQWAATDEEQRHRDIFGYATMWEIYDTWEGKVYHYHECSEQVLYEGQPSNHPFGMFSLNTNQRNLDGLSEVELILEQQVALNDFRSTVNQLAYTLIPRMMYDAGMIDEDQLTRVLHGSVGGFVPVKRKGNAVQKQADLSQIFREVPRPQIHGDMINAMNTAMSDAQFVSSLMPQNRGQAVNIRTAKEASLIEAQERNRISGRMANMEINGIVPVAERVLYYIKKYRQGPHTVKMGKQDWQQLSGNDLLSFKGSYQLTAQSPVKTNPAIIAENLGQLQNMLVQNPDINMREVIALIFEGMGIPKERVLLSPEETAKIQEQMAAQQAAQQGGVNPDAMVAASEQAAQEDPSGGLATAEQTAAAAQEMMG
jgi:hypothetical protein